MIFERRAYTMEPGHVPAFDQAQIDRGFEPTYSDPDRMASLEDVKALPTTTGVLTFSVILGLVAGLALAVAMELLQRMRASYPF